MSPYPPPHRADRPGERRRRCRRRRPSELGGCRLGSISVELALLSPVVLVLLLGAIDFGRAFHEKQRLASAARAGAQFAIENLGTSEVTTGIEDAALTDGQLSADELTITANKSCSCTDGTAAACSSACADGLPPRMHVEVTAQRDFALLFDYPGLPATLALSETATVRAR